MPILWFYSVFLSVRVFITATYRANDIAMHNQMFPFLFLDKW